MTGKKPSTTTGNLQPRPPIIAVLGHVDHGKTTLLDVIRKTSVAAKEHGGITQHIGAYQINYKGEKITFIDTPGHAAFAKMRSYGIAVTDLVILVVACDDGVKPQTKECLAHIKQTNTPFLVAINKIDLPGVSIDMVKGQLAENDVLVEGYGGQIVCVPISAKQKKGIDELLEMAILLTKMQNLKADPKAPAEGVVIDSYLDYQKGPVATILVRNGTLKLGDTIFAGEIEAKVKMMQDEHGINVLEAGPSKPVKVLGFNKVPPIGIKIQVYKILDQKIEKHPPSAVAKEKTSSIAPANDKPEDNKPTRVKIILKTDTKGTLEAIKNNLPEEVEIILSDVGQISESDVLLSLSTKAKIIGFNIKTSNQVLKLAESEKIIIKTYNIIYELLDDLEKIVLRIMEPTFDEEFMGEAKIIASFTMKKKHIAGCKIIKGKIAKANLIHLKRNDKIIADARIISFQKERQEVVEAKTGDEIGLVFSPNIDFKLADVIISYKK